MPDLQQNTLASGELSPHLYGRTDLAKYHSGLMLMKNVFVDYRGGGSSRPGTQFIGFAGGNSPSRLARFVFSATQTYMLVFSHLALQFIRNPLTPGHINGSNAGFILSAGVPYTIATPYVVGDLSKLRMSQSNDIMIITHPSYAPMQLTRITDTNWTLTGLTINTATPTPANLVASITGLPAGSTDPQNTNHSYVVTAVGVDGQESQPSAAGIVTGINIAATQGTITLRWAAVANAQFYFVYKAISSPGGVLVAPSASYGFVGTAYGPEFTDSNIIADFSQSPPSNRNPLANGQVIGYTILNGGATYPVGATTASITDPNGGTAQIIPVLNTNTAGGTAAVIGFIIRVAGRNITNGASIVITGAGGSGFVGTVTTTPASGAEPAVSTYFQQRRIFAGANNRPLTLIGSRVAYYNNFDVSNPVVDSDAYEFTIAAQEVNVIRHMVPMPGGLVIFNDGGVVQLTGGSSNPNNPAAVTPSSAVIVPQSYYGAADITPIVINYDILYVQSEGPIVRDLSYNFFVNIYTGTDLTLMSSHFFYPRVLIDWAYQDTPNKIIWAVRDDGLLLSLTYLKEQEIYGWAQHQTAGQILDIESVREGSTDAVYFVVLRNGNYCIERLADRQYTNVGDIFCLDAALFTAKTFPPTTLNMDGTASIMGSTNVPFTTSVATFSAGDVGKLIRGYGAYGSALITSFINAFQVNCTIAAPFVVSTGTGTLSLPQNSWYTAPLVTTVSGLSHLNGLSVMATVDGFTQGPFTVVGGSVNLSTAGFDVLVGLPYQCQIQQLPPEDQTISAQASKRNRTIATTARVMNTGLGLKFGSSFTTATRFRPDVSSTDTQWVTPYSVPGLVTGEQRMLIDPVWNTQGGVCLQMDDPMPFTVLALINEIAT
jgi:hypothetical protein